MSKDKISDYSSTANSNTDIAAINIDEGCAPSGINNAIRALMAQLKNFQTGASGDSFNGPVGSITPAAGAFTTLSASSTLSVTGAGTIQGLTVGKGAGAVATNTAVGASALASGSLSGGLNTAVGYVSLNGNTTGANNSGFGYGTLSSNTTGASNVAVGTYALNNNTTASYNTAVGYQAGYSQTTGGGGYNTLIGQGAGYSNTAGASNVFVGAAAGYTFNQTSNLDTYNTFVGQAAGNSQSTGTYNTYIGRYAGGVITTGSKNTILGCYNGNQGGLNITTASNYIVLSDGDGNPRQVIDSSGNLLVGTTNANAGSATGFRVINNTSTADRAELGSAASTNSYVGWSMWSTGAGAYRFYVGYGGTVYATSTSISAISDATLKENVRDLETGLSEVMELRPRRFDWINGDAANVAGFIAQEVEQVLPELVTDYVYSKDEEGNDITKKSLKMGDILPTLVKAIQEQQAIITQLQADVAALKGN